ncbi:hypothetical protein [Nocardia wallacei]|uniref:hypothetical protein n=1 Tax=Nocardia wallacei TaxID=480035 RepID=UPI002457B983|nr:hypothetical protein [Nocardia wallacei]
MNDATADNRLRGLETFAQNTAVDLADIKATQHEHTTMLANHSTTLADHTATLAEHTTTLAEHTTTLAEHTAILHEHTVELAEIRSTQAHHTDALVALQRSLENLARTSDARHASTTTMLQALLDDRRR